MTIDVNKITILGSGTSTGIPMLGCPCPVCSSHKNENKRLRSSVILQTRNQSNIVIDTGPDIRTQLLNAKIDHIHAGIITHDHADHSHGIDDLRPYGIFQKQSIPIYAHADCAKTMTDKFPYIFDSAFFQNKKRLGGSIPQLHFEIIIEGSTRILDEKEEVHFLFNKHGHTETLGIVHEKMAYLIDIQELKEEHIEFLKSLNLKLLIIDCVRPTPHSTHLHLDKSLEYIDRISPEFAGLTHIGHELEHFELVDQLRPKYGDQVRPLVDGESFYY